MSVLRPSGSIVPQVVAHRGASASEPEHTAAAYRRALDLGADALECDVRMSADGHLVCVHDRSVQRTSDGRGLISTLDLSDLRRLDWGSWKAAPDGPGHRSDPGPGAGERGPGDREQLLTLRDLLAMVADAGRPVELAVETKHPNRYGGQLERTLAELLAHHGWGRARGPGGRVGPVRMMSFSRLAVRRMRQLAPGLPLVLLMGRVPPLHRAGSLPDGVGAAGIGVQILRDHPEYVARVHARGRAVHVWTVDDPEDVQLCVAAGVEAIITNRPGEVLAQLGR